MKREFIIFLTAINNFTRIPVLKKIKFSEDLLNHAMRYFPLIGWIVGGIGVAVFYFTNYVFPIPIRILLSMAATIIITGAIHEDELAHTFDGFGAGWSKEDILRIINDNRIGSYGAIGLVMVLLLKFMILSVILPLHIPFVLFAGNSISRFASSSFVYTNEYVGETTSSKSKPLGKKISLHELLVASIFGILPMIWLHSWYCFVLLIPVFLTKWLMARYFTKCIDGFTSDCLGATQQITEVVFYLSFVGLEKNLSLITNLFI